MDVKLRHTVRKCIYAMTLFILLACNGPGVVISSPTDGSTVSSPVHVVAAATGKTLPIGSMDILIDNVAAGTPSPSGSIDESIAVTPGSHTITVEAREENGTLYQSTAKITVSGAALSPSRGLVPRVDHVFVVVEENHAFDAVMKGGMPYFVSLATQFGQADNFYGNTHPSIGNYLMMTSGQVFTNSDGYNKTIDIDNIVRQLKAAGKTWRAYAEGLPSVGYVGGNTGSYVRRHNPLSFYSDVVNDSAQKMNLVPVEQFAKDMASGNLPNYSFIVPNLDDDAHDGSLQQADDWLKNNIAPLIGSNAFQNDGLLIVLFDEGSAFDGAHGGGHIPAIVVGSKVRKSFKSTTLYQHQNLLKLTCEALGIAQCPGAASTADDMSEFF